MQLSLCRSWELHGIYSEIDGLTGGLKGVGEICEDVEISEVRQKAKESLMQVKQLS